MVGSFLFNELFNARSKMDSPPLPGDRQCPCLVGAAAWYLWPEKPEHKIISRQPGKPITRATFHEVSA
jgi:hypothetical protein